MKMKNHPKPVENVIFGIHPVEGLLTARPESIEEVYFTGPKNSPALFALLKQCRRQKVNCRMVSRHHLDTLARTSTHQGVVAVCAWKSYEPEEKLDSLLDQCSDAPLLFIPASVHDPQNLGAIIRSCAVFGCVALLVERKQSAPLSEVVARTSAGALEHVPLFRPYSLEKTVMDLKQRGFSVFGADAGKGVPLSSVDLRGPVVLITGNEHSGLPPYLKKLCTALVTIPLHSPAISLNVSNAAAVCLYECRRQRKGPPPLPPR